MDFTAYLEQVNHINQIVRFANSPIIQNAIQINNNFAEIISPISAICQSTQNMEEIYNVGQTLGNIFSEFNIANFQFQQVLNNASLINAVQAINVLPINELAESMRIFSTLPIDVSAFQNVSATVEILNQQTNLYEIFNSISDTVYDELLTDTEYEKKDILEGVEEFIEFVDVLEDDKEDENIVELFEAKKKEFYVANPVYYIIIQIISLLLTIGSVISTCENVYLPMIQDAIIMAEGNDNIYFSKVDITEVYAENVSGSAIVGKLSYGDKVKGIEDTNMWIKVLFTDEKGNECTGWVAKKKLIDYKTWKYNSDSLYTMGD